MVQQSLLRRRFRPPSQCSWAAQVYSGSWRVGANRGGSRNQFPLRGKGPWVTRVQEMLFQLFALTLGPEVDYGDERCRGRDDRAESSYDCPSQDFAKAPPLRRSILLI